MAYYNDPTVKLAKLPQNDSAYKAIARDFNNAGLSVEKIEEVHNDDKFNKFSFEAEALKMKHKREPDFDVNVKSLYHGTTVSVLSLLHEGLDHRLSRHGHFGRGIYFSDNPRKCAHYSISKEDARRTENTSSVLVILRCKVLLGDCKVYPDGQRDTKLVREPEKTRTGDRIVYYDSVMGKPRDYREYVVYENRRALIEYVIHCRKKSKREKRHTFSGELCRPNYLERNATPVVARKGDTLKGNILSPIFVGPGNDNAKQFLEQDEPREVARVTNEIQFNKSPISPDRLIQFNVDDLVNKGHIPTERFVGYSPGREIRSPHKRHISNTHSDTKEIDTGDASVFPSRNIIPRPPERQPSVTSDDLNLSSSLSQLSQSPDQQTSSEFEISSPLRRASRDIESTDNAPKWPVSFDTEPSDGDIVINDRVVVRPAYYRPGDDATRDGATDELGQALRNVRKQMKTATDEEQRSSILTTFRDAYGIGGFGAITDTVTAIKRVTQSLVDDFLRQTSCKDPSIATLYIEQFSYDVTTAVRMYNAHSSHNETREKNRKLVYEFMEYTNCTEVAAEKYLALADGDLNRAADLYFSQSLSQVTVNDYSGSILEERNISGPLNDSPSDNIRPSDRNHSDNRPGNTSPSNTNNDLSNVDDYHSRISDLGHRPRYNGDGDDFRYLTDTMISNVGLMLETNIERKMLRDDVTQVQNILCVGEAKAEELLAKANHDIAKACNLYYEGNS